jgi:PAS domain S-box-containing protein
MSLQSTVVLPMDEAHRLDLLRRYEVLDAPADPVLAALARVAAQVCAAPAAVVSFVDAQRERAAAVAGPLPRTFSRDLARDDAFCVHAMQATETFVVPDARDDPRFAASPIVTGADGVRFYAAAPLRTPDGTAIGTLAVVDTVARSIDAAQLEALCTLAGSVMAHLELLHAQRESGRERTVRADAERRKQARDERYELAVRGSTAGLWDWDMRTDDVYFSPRFTQLLEYADVEYAPRFSSFEESLHPDDRPAVAAAMAAHLSRDETPFDQDYRLRTKSGAYRWFNARGQAVRDADGVPYRMAGSIVDITDRRKALDALRESEERFRLLSRATNDAIWDWDLDTDTLWWNDGYFSLFGYARSDTPPDISSWKGRIAESDRDRVTTGIRAAIDEGAESWSDEYRYRRADGTLAYVLDRGYVIRDDAGRAVRMIGGMTDLTERKRAEEQTLRAQRMESIGTLAGGIAHDLNNLLAPMLMSVELLRASVRDDEALELLRTVQVSAQRGAELVQQVLSFARGVEGQRVPLSPALLVREVQKITRDTFPAAIRTVVTHGDDLWSVLGDPTQLHQVLLNLVLNASDAMAAGGTLTIAVENVTVDDALADATPEARPGDYVVLRVTDTGTGIDPAVRGRIFEPFFSTKDTGRGTGLGLSTSLAIVRSHGGFISLYSEPGMGSTFRVYLPASRTSVATPSSADQAPYLALGKGEMVLIVDDEPAIRRVAQRTLERFGYCVLSAENGAEALTLYRARGHEIDVVLTDMAMPVMDGPALISALRAIDPDVRIVGSSGRSSMEGVGKSLGAPITHFVAKPYTAETLLQTLRDALSAGGHASSASSA